MMAMRRLGRLMIAVHSPEPPTDSEWSRWVQLGLEEPTEALRLFVETQGFGGPNAKQRKHLADNLTRFGMRCAIVTDSAIVRGIVTAVAWLGVELRAFAPDDQQSAADYLDLSAEEHAALREALPALRDEADGAAGRPDTSSAR